MLKNVSRVLSAVICAGLMLAAASSGARAAEVTFKATDGQVLGTQNVYLYEMYANGGGFVKVTYLNGASSLFVDGASLGSRILLNLPQLVNVTGTNTYVDPAYGARSVCVNGVSIVALSGSGVQVQATDNCAMFQQIQAKAK